MSSFYSPKCLEEIDPRVFRIVSKHDSESGYILFRAILDNNNPLIIDTNLLTMPGISLELDELLTIPEALEIEGNNIVTTGSFWTCECKNNWLHHDFEISCPHCLRSFLFSTGRCRYISQVLQEIRYQRIKHIN